MFSCEIWKAFKNTCTEEHLRTTTSEFVGDTTLEVFCEKRCS